jgi:hypothetical protein
MDYSCNVIKNESDHKKNDSENKDNEIEVREFKKYNES